MAYREATTLEFPRLVKELTKIIGKKLRAYIASVKDARAIERWIARSESYKGVEERLRLAYRLAQGLVLVAHVYAGHFDFHFASPRSRFGPRRLLLLFLFVGVD